MNSDLVEASLVMVRGRMEKALRGEAREAVEKKLLKLLSMDAASKTDAEKLREKLRSGELDDESVDLGSLGVGQSPLSDANGTFGKRLTEVMNDCSRQGNTFEVYIHTCFRF